MSKKILIAPLNWGLGHASRSMPIIDALLSEGHEVILASDGAAKRFLEIEYPALLVEELPSYKITYPKSGLFLFHMMKRIPYIWGAIKSEKKVLDSLVEKHNLDIVISDNRYGMYCSKVRTIMITHQIKVALPLGEWLISQYIQKRLKYFSEVWVPDVAGENNLSGKLSHGKNTQKSIQYIGALSRLSARLEEQQILDFPFKDDFILIIVSGPEPQRTMFENQLVTEAKNESQNYVVVGGNPLANETQTWGNVYLTPFVNASCLKWLMKNSIGVISRSGYSTVMDLIAMKKVAVLIPTPGQTEQEYLATYLQKNKVFLCKNQGAFNLCKASQELSEIEWSPELETMFSPDKLSTVIKSL